MPTNPHPISPLTLGPILFLCRKETAAAFQTALSHSFPPESTALASSAEIRAVVADASGAAVQSLPPNILLFLLGEEEEAAASFPREWQERAEYAFSPPFDGEAILRHIVRLLGEPSSRPSLLRIRQQTAECLTSLHIPPRLLGHRYLLEGVEALFLEPFPGRTRLLQRIYAHGAEKFGSSPVMVDRAIRHGVEVCWKKTSPARLKSLFGYDSNDLLGMPTNGEFLYALYEHVRARLAPDMGEKSFLHQLHLLSLRYGMNPHISL